MKLPLLKKVERINKSSKSWSFIIDDGYCAYKFILNNKKALKLSIKDMRYLIIKGINQESPIK